VSCPREALTRLSPHIRDLSYTSDSRDLTVEKAIPSADIALAEDGISPAIDGISTPAVTQNELEGFGIGL
jgi:hypothetical protein